MKKWYPLVLLTTALLLSVGCAKDQNQIKIPKDAAKMDVDFSWEGIPACSHESPEIRVSKVPEGTQELRVRLKNIDIPAWNQGGGKVKYDGSGIIPAGALKLGYNGPCPPGGRLKYEFSIMAVNAEGVIIGFGKARQSFPPKK
ncbi:YbhB/YbcL family Raf kinase inhibitor-like protein [uncultured Desulfosarcina sp.]|uniref:YbhB/YbcL family Raf kinase inhibitor-like protein n=1 Tax=uncultured Desulfosarcina sp. TaxID=218289 RepID=UPI0029C656FA|nr:YbhB/YbcL family Raf kinase inhibitor-like protein [uncultured Desulfosarcina sp.]